MYKIFTKNLGLMAHVEDFETARRMMERYAGGPRNLTRLSSHSWVEDENGKKVAECDRSNE